MNVLILGGTSFFGKEIARQFVDAGHAVSVFTRGQAKPKDMPAVEYITGDRTQPEDLLRAAAQKPWDVLIDNLAFTGADVEIALQAFPQVKRYLLTSTISVYRYATPGTPQPMPERSVTFDYIPKEEDLENEHWSYARGKLEAERTLRAQTSVPWTIFRPTMVYGPNDNKARGFWYLSRLLDGGPILMADGGLNSIRLAYSVDLGLLYLLAAQQQAAAGRTYNVAQTEIINLKDFLLESADALKLRPQLISVPLELLGGLAGPLAYDRPWIPGIRPSTDELSYRPTPWREFVRSTALWFKENFRGDLRKLKATRDDELRIAERWKLAVKTFKTV